MIQADKALEAFEQLGDRVFGLVVAHKGHTVQLFHSGNIGEGEFWLVTAWADDGDEGVEVEARSPDMVAALDECAAQAERIENPQGRPKIPDGPDEDPASY